MLANRADSLIDQFLHISDSPELIQALITQAVTSSRISEQRTSHRSNSLRELYLGGDKNTDQGAVALLFGLASLGQHQQATSPKRHPVPLPPLSRLIH